GLLGLGDLADLVPTDLADLVLVRLTAALLDTGGLQQQFRGGRGLELEVERAVLVDGDLDRHHVAALRFGRGVVGLAELHDVDAVRTQRRADRGRRVRGTRLNLQLDDRCKLLLLGWHFRSCSVLLVLTPLPWCEAWPATERSRSSDLGDLVERQLDRSLPAEDRHQNLQFLRVHVHLADRGGQRGERAVHDRDALADLEVHFHRARSHLLLGGGLALGFGRGGLLDLGREELHDLIEAQGRRTRGSADESGHARRVPNRAPRRVVHLHPDKDVAGQHLPLHDLTLTVLDLGDLFGGHLDLEDVVLDVERLPAGLDV